MKIQTALFVFLFLSLNTNMHAQKSKAAGPEGVIKAMSKLSDATAPNGGGADAYAAVLAEGFTRWTIGSEKINRKEDWVKGMRDWFDSGWRVTSRKNQFMDMEMKGNLAFTRRIVVEKYLSPKGEKSSAKAALDEVWERIGEDWLLLRVNLHPIKE